MCGQSILLFSFLFQRLVLHLAEDSFLGPAVLLLVVSFSWAPLCGMDQLLCVVLDLAGARLSWTNSSAAGG